MKLTLQQLDAMTDKELRHHLCTEDGKGKEKKDQILDELLWRHITRREIELKKELAALSN
jgi:hypothetical protein